MNTSVFAEIKGGCVECMLCSAVVQKQGAKVPQFCLKSLSGTRKCPSGTRIASRLIYNLLLSVRQGTVYFT